LPVCDGSNNRAVSVRACCGLQCTACAVYIATQDNNDELRKETAALWGRHLDYCTICIRQCCIEKNIQNCTFCSEYPWVTLDSGHVFLSEVLEMELRDELEAEKNLDPIRTGVHIIF